MNNRIDIINLNSRSSSLITFVTDCISTSFQVSSIQDNKFNNNHLLISSAAGNSLSVVYVDFMLSLLHLNILFTGYKKCYDTTKKLMRLYSFKINDYFHYNNGELSDSA